MGTIHHSRRKTPSAALLIGLLACAAAGTAARAQDIRAGASAAEPCADYGSFAVVDPPGGGRGVLQAHPFASCADLPAARGQNPTHIGVEVMIGGQSNEQGGANQNMGTPQGPGLAPAPYVRPRGR